MTGGHGHGGGDAGGPGQAGDGDRQLLDFSRLVRRLFWTAVSLAAVAVAGATVQGLVSGLTFSVLGQWAALFAVVLIVAWAAVIAIHAAGGARRARRRGERLSGDDVRLVPPAPRSSGDGPSSGGHARARDGSGGRP